MLRAFGSGIFGSDRITQSHECEQLWFLRRDVSQQNVLCDHVVTLALGCSRVSLYS